MTEMRVKECKLLSAAQAALPRAAEMLGEPPHGVRVLETGYSFHPVFDGPEPDYDVHMGQVGLYDDAPFVFRRPPRKKAHSNAPFYWSGLGLVLRRSPASGGTPYVVMRLSFDGVDREVVFVRKEEAARLVRGWKKYHRRKPVEAPMLPDELLDRVYRNTVGFLKRRRDIARFGVRPVRGLLLYGPPGNGKTMLTRYIVGEARRAGLSTGHITASEFEAAFANNNMAELFTRAQVITFDDVDVSYFSRSRGGDARKACAALAAMDGVGEQRGGVVRIFTTNEELATIDPAFRRPGRIDLAVSIPLPTQDLRLRLARKWPADIAVDRERVARETEGFSFAELEFVRTTLVTNHLLDGGWDLDAALAEARSRNEDTKGGKRAVGFGPYN